jgi:hypothetical protein
VNLLTWLNSKKYAEAIRRIRMTNNAALRHKMKSELPAITPSGLFTVVNEHSMVRHSGYVQFDIDKIEDDRFKIREIQKQIANITNVAYCGISASGNGLWGLVRIAYPDKHLLHWQYMKQIFMRYDIAIDEAPKNICSLRGYSYDPHAYFNHQATLLTNYATTPPLPPPPGGLIGNDNRSIIARLVKQLVDTETDITEGYNNWFALGCIIAGNFGESGRALFQNISQFNHRYDVDDCNKKYDDCKKATRDGNIGFFVKRCKEYKVVLGR